MGWMDGSKVANEREFLGRDSAAFLVDRSGRGTLDGL